MAASLALLHCIARIGADAGDDDHIRLKKSLLVVGALLFDEPAHAPRWFAAFIGLVILNGVVQPFTGSANNLSTPLATFFFVINPAGRGDLYTMDGR
jgi:hypothetical protein